MIEEVRKYVSASRRSEGLQILDERMSNLFKVGFLQNFRVPTLTKVWETGITLQANEYRSIMQVLLTKNVILFVFPN